MLITSWQCGWERSAHLPAFPPRCRRHHTHSSQGDLVHIQDVHDVYISEAGPSLISLHYLRPRYISRESSGLCVPNIIEDAVKYIFYFLFLCFNFTIIKNVQFAQHLATRTDLDYLTYYSFMWAMTRCCSLSWPTTNISKAKGFQYCRNMRPSLPGLPPKFELNSLESSPSQSKLIKLIMPISIKSNLWCY